MVDPRRGRTALLLLAALFFVPLFIAWIWFVNVGPGDPEAVGAHGELIHPARPLGEFEFRSPDGRAAVSDRTLDGRWAIVHVGGPRCDEGCRESLWETRQVHTRLGRDGVRVQRVYLLVDAGDFEDPGYFASEHPNLLVGRVGRADPLLAQFPGIDEGRTYLVDPLGNLMMSYTPEAGPRDLLEDLRRLLRVSRIG